jgi:hypothetical protein
LLSPCCLHKGGTASLRFPHGGAVSPLCPRGDSREAVPPCGDSEDTVPVSADCRDSGNVFSGRVGPHPMFHRGQSMNYRVWGTLGLRECNFYYVSGGNPPHARSYPTRSYRTSHLWLLKASIIGYLGGVQRESDAKANFSCLRGQRQWRHRRPSWTNIFFLRAKEKVNSRLHFLGNTSGDLGWGGIP